MSLPPTPTCHGPSQRDREKPDARHQVTGREGWLSSAHRCKSTHERQGQDGHQGAAMTQAIPASPELVGKTVVIQVGAKTQEAPMKPLPQSR